MTQFNEMLMDAFNDYCLSKHDPQHLYDCLLEYKNDVAALKGIQQKSFALVHDYLQRQPTFDAHAFGWLEYVVNTLEKVKCHGSMVQKY